MRHFFLFLIFVFSCRAAFSEKNPKQLNNRKSALAYKIKTPPRIDGMATDSVWKAIPPIADFRQYEPTYDASTNFRTEVKIAYDDYAIYVLAYMYDPYPDSILRQLGLRDEEHLNADFFSIEFDTYNNQLDAYTYSITASGVQIDTREKDETYDAVWDSEVRITSDGWVAELKIPYSALRFAKMQEQLWGMQISRSIRRNRQLDQWSLELLDSQNNLPNWGTLAGIENIEPPLRLSATPYLLLGAEHYPYKTSEKDISTAFGGGMDIKYGINEGFTLDMSLLPDFSQVQSDNKIKNLTAFETVYEEQRPFFKEAVDLFTKGNIFYSRRIGKTPYLFYSVEDSLNEGESISKNPVKQQLVNATKVSGRNKHGLAIGFLNALTANTYAVINESSEGTRKMLTDPLTNYNELVFDQAMRNNSSIYITNTSVIRKTSYRDANVTASGITLNNFTNTYQLAASAGLSQVITQRNTGNTGTDVKRGYKYNLKVAKVKGNFLFSAGRETMNDKFDANDMGLTLYNNYNNNTASISYNFYTPFWILRNLSNKLTLTNQNNFTTHKPQTNKLAFNWVLNTLDYLTIWAEAGHFFTETYDYYEPRTNDRYYIKPKASWFNLGFSSDYRKRVAIDGGLHGNYSARNNTKGYTASIAPILRFSDHLTFRFSLAFMKDINDYGYAATQGDQVIFGNRDISTWENSLSGEYLFKNNISLSMVARHYIAQGKYNSFYTLEDDGYLTMAPDYDQNHDFTFNSFNVDMVFAWIFAPGSSLNIVWKNEIVTEKDNITGDYFANLGDNYNEPQLNNISLKILYYIDYQKIKK